jgi:hypothetical protein
MNQQIGPTANGSILDLLVDRVEDGPDRGAYNPTTQTWSVQTNQTSQNKHHQEQ